MPASPQVPFNDLLHHWEPHTERLSRTLDRVARSGWFVLGREVAQFEEAFAAFCDTPGCVGVGNGTDALEIALRAVGCGAGDEVIVTGNAGGYGTIATLSIGATPVVVDVDPVNLLIAPASIAAGISDKTKAVIATHLYGNVVDIDAVRAQCGSVPIIEDCAQAHGASFAGRPVGSLGDAAAFSFYPTKNLGALGDAGAVVSRSADIVDAARSLRKYGWSERYDVRLPGGRNSRLDEVQAAVLTEFLADLTGWNERRLAIRARYADALGELVPIVPLTGEPSQPVVHLCVARSRDRGELIRELAESGVTCEVHFPIADHQQVGLRGLVRHGGDLSVTEAACAEVFSLPCFPTMTETQIEKVIAAVMSSSMVHG